MKYDRSRTDSHPGPRAFPELAQDHYNPAMSWLPWKSRTEPILGALLLAGDVACGDGGAATDSSFASIVFTGAEYGLAWQEEVDGEHQRIRFGRLSADGQPLGDPVVVGEGAGMSSYPSLAWTGDGFALVWQDDRDGNYEIYLARLDCQ